MSVFNELFEDFAGRPRHAGMSDRDIMLFLARGLHAMAIDTSKLTAAISQLDSDVTVLAAAHASDAAQVAKDEEAAQAAVNGAVDAVAAIDKKATDALAPPAPATVA